MRLIGQTFLLSFGFIAANSNWFEPVNPKSDALYVYDIPMEATLEGKSYYRHLSGCYEMYSAHSCLTMERLRVAANRNQPALQHNYSSTGFQVSKVPHALLSTIQKFFRHSYNNMTIETWKEPFTFFNHWESPVYAVHVDSRQYESGVQDLKRHIYDETKIPLQKWIGKNLYPISMYGITIFLDNAIMMPYVSRIPQVISCIINVDDKLYKPWPLLVIGHDGVQQLLTLDVGEMLIYESLSVVIGRPHKLEGEYAAQLMIHYCPQDLYNSLITVSQHQRYSSPYGGQDEGGGRAESSELHIAAGTGDIKSATRIIMDSLNDRISVMQARDANGWLPLHEAVRAGNMDMVQLLVDFGADIGAVTNNGGTPLWWAKRLLGEHHKIVQYLHDIGAPDHSVDFEL